MEITCISDLVDCSEQEFRDFCSTKDLGFLMGTSNFLKLLYNNMSSLCSELVSKTEKMKQEGDSEKIDEYVHTIEGLHSKLLRVEQRVFILKEIMSPRLKTE